MNEEILDQEVELTEEPEVSSSEEVAEQEEPKQETVPLHVLLDEKKRRKELEKKLRDFEEREIDSDILETKSRIKQRYLNKGYDEDIAELLAEDHADLKKEIKKLSSKSQKDPLEEDIEDLAKDSFYSDATAYSKEIKSKISEFSKKGIEISVEDAYNLVRNPKIKLKELRENEEQQELVSRRDSTKRTIPNASTSSPKNPYPLDEVDKKALANLQRAQPNGGWTVEKYYKIRHNQK